MRSEACYTMNVTSKLLRVFQVDRQLSGLEGRLRKAERFLAEQTHQLGVLSEQIKAVQGQLRQLKASAGNLESEITEFDGHIEKHREQMNSAQTNKAYKAFLTEVNTFKAERDRREEDALGLLTKIEELMSQAEELDKAHAERDKMREVAQGERSERSTEIADRVEELKAQRKNLLGDVPADVLAIYDELVHQLDEDAMAELEVADRKRHEYTCGSCMMGIPMESAISLLSGKLTRCPSCGCILYLSAETTDLLTPAEKR